jgi:hypothetical protein
MLGGCDGKIVLLPSSVVSGAARCHGAACEMQAFQLDDSGGV